MILWLAPGALAAFALLAGPIVVHMLARRGARRVVFPAAHFVRPAQAAAVRLRRPSDPGLLALRLAIVAAAAVAAARPLVLTPWRLAQWDARTSRAVIVDASQGMQADTSALAAGQAEGVFRARRIDAADLAAGLESATRWLATVPPSRRDVVVISDFQRGAVDRESLRRVAPGTGIRFIRAGAPPAERTATLAPVDGWRGARWQPSVTVDGSGTRTSWMRSAAPQAHPAWLTVAAPAADAAAADRALRAAASFGVAAGDDGRRAVVIFAGGDASGNATPVRTPWMAEAAAALRASNLLRDVGVEVTIEARDGRLAVRTPVAATASTAPLVIRAVMLAVRPAAIADPEMETRTIPDTELVEWRREAAPIAGPDGRDSSTLARELRETGEGEEQPRWLWALALILLGIEGQVRRERRHAATREAHADAA